MNLASNVTCLLTVSLLVTTGMANGYDAVPGETVEALQKYSKLDSVQWTWSGQIRYSAEGKPVNYETKGIYTRLGNKFATEFEHKSKSKTVAKSAVRFDGKTIARSNGEDQLAWYSIDKLSQSQPSKAACTILYFEAIGVQYPKEHKALELGVFKSKILSLIDNKCKVVRVGEERLDGNQVLVVEFESPYEGPSGKDKAPESVRLVYYLSKAHDYAVVMQQRKLLTGQIYFEARMGAFQREKEEWPSIGKEAVVKSFVNVEKKEFSVESEPQETSILKLNGPRLATTEESDFVINMANAKAGAQLIDGVSPELQNANGTVSVFNMPASSADLDKAIAAASAKRTRSYRIVIVACALVIALGLTVAYARYRKRR
jgi:hypothetical protein